MLAVALTIQTLNDAGRQVKPSSRCRGGWEGLSQDQVRKPGQKRLLTCRSWKPPPPTPPGVTLQSEHTTDKMDMFYCFDKLPQGVAEK